MNTVLPFILSSKRKLRICVCLLTCFVCIDTSAQQFSEGINGTVDKKRRSPVVSIGLRYVNSDGTSVNQPAPTPTPIATVTPTASATDTTSTDNDTQEFTLSTSDLAELSENSGAETVISDKATATTADAKTAKIIVDAYVPNDEFTKYPIKFDFFINSKLFTSQLREVSNSGSIGVDIGPDVAVPPFKYSIVATLIHPNRQYSTVVNGTFDETVTSADPNSSLEKLNCTLTLTNADESDQVYTSSDNVSASVVDDSTSTVSFIGTNDSNQSRIITASIKISEGSDTDDTAEVIVREGSESTSYNLSGSITKDENNAISSVALSSDDQRTTLDCDNL